MKTFHDPGKDAFWNQWEKKKMLVTSIFSYSHTVFKEKLPRLSHIDIVVCKSFQEKKFCSLV